MNKVKKTAIALTIISIIIAIGGGVYYFAFRAPFGPKIPKSKIPADIPQNVRKHIEKLYSRDVLERMRSAHELGKIKGKAAPAVPFLIGMLDDYYMAQESSVPVAEIATYALTKIGEPAVKPLLSALEDKNTKIRWNAASTLGMIGSRQAIKPLTKLLADEDTIVRWSAKIALSEITGKSPEQDK